MFSVFFRCVERHANLADTGGGTYKHPFCIYVYGKLYDPHKFSSRNRIRSVGSMRVCTHRNKSLSSTLNNAVQLQFFAHIQVKYPFWVGAYGVRYPG